tara:strand:- start:232 stop:483 length:252 start_codon:yes stop_codon:yes gene_type:complete
MTRKPKATIKQLEERIEQLENAMGEVQQFVNLVGNSARNDIMRHEDMIQMLCDKAEVSFHPHPIPENHELVDEKVEESAGESE